MRGTRDRYAPQLDRPDPGHLVRPRTRHLHGAARFAVGESRGTPITPIHPRSTHPHGRSRSTRHHHQRHQHSPNGGPGSARSPRSARRPPPTRCAASSATSRSRSRPGTAAVVLKHIAYGYDFAHAGSCAETALGWIFAEPDYDRPAFTVDAARRADPPGRGRGRLGRRGPDLRGARAGGLAGHVRRAAVLGPGRVRGRLAAPGRRRAGGGVRDRAGGAEFPEARRGRQASLGYVHAEGREDPQRVAAWEESIRARYRVAFA